MRIQERLNGNPLVTDRKSRDEDFPLRGFIVCGDCGSPLTSCWATSRSKARHPYYHCFKQGCVSKGKSIQRDRLEGEFENLVKTLEPDEMVFGIASQMLKDAWDQRGSQTGARLRGLEAEREKIDASVNHLLDTITSVRSPTVLASFEKRVEELEAERLLVAERIARLGHKSSTFDRSVRTALAFLRNPWQLWSFGTYEHKRLLLQLCFSKRVAYQRNVGLRTAELALPFKLLDTLRTGEKEDGGRGWIRTSVRSRGQIYSLLPLTTRPPFQPERGF